MKKKERLEREVKDVKHSLDQKQNELKDKLVILAEQQEVVTKLETTLREQKAIVEKAVKDYEFANQKVKSHPPSFVLSTVWHDINIPHSWRLNINTASDHTMAYLQTGNVDDCIVCWS